MYVPLKKKETYCSKRLRDSSDASENLHANKLLGNIGKMSMLDLAERVANRFPNISI